MPVWDAISTMVFEAEPISDPGFFSTEQMINISLLYMCRETQQREL